ALQSLIAEMKHEGVKLIIVGLKTRIIVKLRRAGVHKEVEELTYCRHLAQARTVALRWQKEQPEDLFLGT
ncbi:STAS domain-containing protein, partial [Halomonas vilamensis]